MKNAFGSLSILFILELGILFSLKESIDDNFTLSLFILIFYTIISGFALFIGYRGVLSANPNNKSKAILGAIVLKLAFGMFFLLGMYVQDQDTVKEIAAQFLGIYFSFLIFTTFWLVRFTKMEVPEN